MSVIIQKKKVIVAANIGISTPHCNGHKFLPGFPVRERVWKQVRFLGRACEAFRDQGSRCWFTTVPRALWKNVKKRV